MKIKEDQLHTAVSLYLAGRIIEENTTFLINPLMPDIENNQVPNDMGKILMTKKFSVGAIIIYSYAIENLVKSFSPQIKKRHLSIIDIPYDLGLNEIEALVFTKTIFPLLKYYIHKFSINLKEIKCFKVEFFHFKYPFIDELIAE